MGSRWPSTALPYLAKVIGISGIGLPPAEARRGASDEHQQPDGSMSLGSRGMARPFLRGIAAKRVPDAGRGVDTRRGAVLSLAGLSPGGGPMRRVTDHVYAEDQYLVATVGFLVTREGVVLMDTPMLPSDAAQWRSRAEGHGAIRYIINTEHHRDHIIGNAFFPGTVIAQAGTAERFMRSIVSPAAVRGFLEKLDPQGAHSLPNYVPRPPTIIFHSHLVLHLGDHTLDLR